MAIERPWVEPTKGRVPAWLMSGLLHLVVLVLLAVLWQNVRPVAKGATESSRTGGIVVAVSNSGETEYFDESDAEAAADAAAHASGKSASSPTAALPTMEQQVELPDISLPGAVTGSVAGELTNGVDLGLRGAPCPPALIWLRR